MLGQLPPTCSEVVHFEATELRFQHGGLPAQVVRHDRALELEGVRKEFSESVQTGPVTEQAIFDDACSIGPCPCQYNLCILNGRALPHELHLECENRATCPDPVR